MIVLPDIFVPMEERPPLAGRCDDQPSQTMTRCVSPRVVLLSGYSFQQQRRRSE